MSQKQWAEVWHSVQNWLKDEIFLLFVSLFADMGFESHWSMRCCIVSIMGTSHLPQDSAEAQTRPCKGPSLGIYKLPSVPASLQSFLLPSFAWHINKTLKTSWDWSLHYSLCSETHSSSFWKPDLHSLLSLKVHSLTGSDIKRGILSRNGGSSLQQESVT